MPVKPSKKGEGLAFPGGMYADAGVAAYTSLAQRGTNSITIAAWVKVFGVLDGKFGAIVSAVAETDLREHKKKGVVLGFGPDSQSRSVWTFGVRTAVSDNLVYVHSDVQVMGSFDEPQWTHIAATYGDGEAIIYVNGVPHGSMHIGGAIDFDISKSKVSISPRLMLMTYGVNGIAPVAPCCTEADLADTGIWYHKLDADTVKTQASVTKISLRPWHPDVYFKLTSTMARRAVAKSAVSSIGVAGAVTIVQKDAKQRIVSRMAPETATDGGSQMLNRIEAASVSPSIRDAIKGLLKNEQLNSAQLAHGLSNALAANEENVRSQIKAAVSSHAVSTKLSTSDRAAFINSINGAAGRFNDAQLQAAWKTIVSTTDYADVVQVFVDLLGGRTPRTNTAVQEAMKVASAPSGSWLAGVDVDGLLARIRQDSKREASAEAKRMLRGALKAGEASITTERAQLRFLRKQLNESLKRSGQAEDAARAREESAHNLMTKAMTVAKAAAKSITSANAALQLHGFAPLPDVTRELVDPGHTAQQDTSSLHQTAEEAAAVAALKLTSDALAAARVRERVACDEAATAKAAYDSSAGQDATADAHLADVAAAKDKLCADASAAVAQREAEKSRAEAAAAHAKSALRDAIRSQRGDYATLLNTSATSAAEYEALMQRSIEAEQLAVAHRDAAIGRGDLSASQSWDAEAKKSKARAQMAAQAILQLQTQGADITNPVVNEAQLALGSQNPNWLKFTAQNLETVSSREWTDAQAARGVAAAALKACKHEISVQWGRINDLTARRAVEAANQLRAKRSGRSAECNRLAKRLKEAEAAVLVAKARLDSIKGVRYSGNVATPSERERRQQNAVDAALTSVQFYKNTHASMESRVNQSAVDVDEARQHAEQEREKRLSAEAVARQSQQIMQDYANDGANARRDFLVLALRLRPVNRPLNRTALERAVGLVLSVSEDQVRTDEVIDLSVVDASLSVPKSAEQQRRRRLLGAVRRRLRSRSSLQLDAAVPSTDMLVQMRVFATIADQVRPLAVKASAALTDGTLATGLLNAGIASQVSFVRPPEPFVDGKMVDLANSKDVDPKLLADEARKNENVEAEVREQIQKQQQTASDIESRAQEQVAAEDGDDADKRTNAAASADELRDIQTQLSESAEDRKEKAEQKASDAVDKMSEIAEDVKSQAEEAQSKK